LIVNEIIFAFTRYAERTVSNVLSSIIIKEINEFKNINILGKYKLALYFIYKIYLIQNVIKF